MFKLIGQRVSVQLNTVERCSGHAGTYGVKTPTHPVAMKIGRPVFKAMAQGRARLHQQRLRARRPPHRAGHGAGRHAGQGAAASAEPAAARLRIGVTRSWHPHHPRQPDDAGGLLEGAQGASRRRSSPHRRLRSVRAGRAHQRAVRGRDRPSATRSRRCCASRRSSSDEGIQQRDRGLRAAGARRHQLEGDDADRVPRSARAQARAGAPDRRRGPHVRRGRGPRARLRDRRRRPRSRERREDLVGALRALRVAAGGARRGARRRRACAWAATTANYPAHVSIAPETLASLAGDLR